MVAFNYLRSHKKVVEFYLNATITSDGTIKSKVGGVEVLITIENIKIEFQLPKASDFDVSSHGSIKMPFRMSKK